MRQITHNHNAKMEHQISVGFVSRMWECDKEDPECNDRESERLWEEYRDFNSDYIPVQVKNLAVWVELCYRYSPKICVIGHRSGFIEAAALVGIPTFYLNNERKKIDRGRDFMTAGDTLWRPMKNPEGSRLRLLGEAMNTFIAIESLYEPDPKDGSNKASESSKQTAETSHDGRKKQSKSDKAPTKIYRVHQDYKYELASALFMFMCCEIIPGAGDPGNPVKAMWNGRVPAWTQRVRLIHYNNQKGWKKLERKLRGIINYFPKLMGEVQQEKRRLRTENPGIARSEVKKATNRVKEAAVARFKKPERMGTQWLRGAVGHPAEKLKFEGRLGQQWLKANYDFAIRAIKRAEDPNKPKGKRNEGPPRSHQYKELFNSDKQRFLLQRLSVFEVHDTFAKQG